MGYPPGTASKNNLNKSNVALNLTINLIFQCVMGRDEGGHHRDHYPVHLAHADDCVLLLDLFEKFKKLHF